MFDPDGASAKRRLCDSSVQNQSPTLGYGMSLLDLGADLIKMITDEVMPDFYNEDSDDEDPQSLRAQNNRDKKLRAKKVDDFYYERGFDDSADWGRYVTGALSNSCKTMHRVCKPLLENLIRQEMKMLRSYRNQLEVQVLAAARSWE